MEAVTTSAKNGQHPLSGALVQVVMLHKRAHRNVGDRRKLAAQTLRLYFFRTHQLNQDCFLCMQSVFSLVEDFICMRFEHLGGDLFFTVSGQAVENHCAGTCSRENLVIDLEACKSLASFDSFAFLTHRSPDVSFEDVGIGCHFFDVVADTEVAAVFLCKFHNGGMGMIAFRAGDRDLHTDRQCADDQRVGHIVAIADVAEVQTLKRALVFADSHQVSQNLQGCA